MDKTPKHHGELYFEPDMKSWKDGVLRNREKLSSVQFWGQSAAKVRATLKMPTDRPIIMTGHQPVFFHPGLWVKCLAASHLAQAVSGIAYHKVTNTAMAPEYTHYLPELDDKIGARKKELDFFVSKELKKEEKAVPYVFFTCAGVRTASKNIVGRHDLWPSAGQGRGALFC